MRTPSKSAAAAFGLGLGLALGGPAHAQGPDPFDPNGYIDHKETQKTKASAALTSLGIIRLNGQRFMQFNTDDGSVFLPCPSERPELHEEFALCPQHLRLLGEVLPLRQNMPVDAETRKHEAFLVALVRKCAEGRVGGPVATEQSPDGAVIEKRAKVKPKEAHHTPAENRINN